MNKNITEIIAGVIMMFFVLFSLYISYDSEKRVEKQIEKSIK